MVFDVRFFPGFPLPVHDYAELMVELTRYEGPAQRVVIAHSLGALEALFFKPGEDVSMVLLAPSTLDKPRRGRVLVRGCLRGLSWLPVAGEAIARLLREHAYKRYAAQPPAGAPLSLGAAADRLHTTAPKIPRAYRGPCTVVCSPEDSRHPAQLRLAEELGATVLWVEGGHLFPVTRGRATAEIILEALGGLDHPG